MRKKVCFGIASFVMLVLIGTLFYFKNITSANANAYVGYSRISDTSYAIEAEEDESYNMIEAEFFLYNLRGCSVNVDSSWKIVNDKISESEFTDVLDDENTGAFHSELIAYKQRFYLVRTTDEAEKNLSKNILTVTCSKNEINTKVTSYDIIPTDTPTISMVDTNKYSFSFVSKLDGETVTSVKKGEEFLYEISITGDNYYNYKAVFATYVLPDEFEIVDALDATVVGQTLTWDLGVPETGKYSKTLSVKVKAKETGEFINSAIVKVGTDEQVVKNKINVYYSDIDLTINKSVNEATVGDAFTYDLLLKNTGNIESENVVVDVKLDADLKILASSTKMTEKDGKYYFSLGKIAAGKTQNINLKLQLNRDASEKDVVSVVNVTEDGKTPMTETISIKSLKPNLVISANSDKSSIRKGEQAKVTVKIKNTGNGISKNVNLTYAIDKSFEVESIEGNTSIASLAKNAETNIIINLKALQNANMKTTNNIFTITSDNASSVNKTIAIDISDSNLEIERNISKNDQISNNVIKPSEEFSYIIKIKNSGKIKAENVVYQELVNSDIDFVSGVAIKNGESINGAINEKGMTFNLGTINANEEYSIVVTSKVKSDAKLNSTIDTFGMLKETGKDDIEIQNSIIVSNSDLYIYVTKSKEKVGKNDEITLTYNVVNSSDSNAEKVNVESVLPTEFEFVSSSFTEDELTIKDNVVNVHFSNVDAMSTRKYSLTLKTTKNISDNTKLSIKNTVTSGDNIFEYITSVETIDSNVGVDVKSSLKEVKIGDEIILSINVENKGRKNASKIVLTYKIDEKLKIVDADGGKIQNNIITWNLDGLEALSTKEINVKVKVLEKGDKYLNTLTLKEDGKDGIEENTSFTYKDEISNPKTGTFINLVSISVFLIIGLLIIFKSKRRNIINKI